jgi:hypothetical protein
MTRSRAAAQRCVSDLVGASGIGAYGTARRRHVVCDASSLEDPSMRRVLVLSLSTVALLAGLSMPVGARAGAVVAKDDMCGLFDGDGGIVMGASSIQVTNAGGVAIVKCSVKNVANSTGRAVHYNFATTNMPCGTVNGSTEDWHETVSANGNATLTCRFKK